MKLLFATHNRHKVSELSALLAPHGWQVLSLWEAGIELDVEEDAPSFVANAEKKARAALAASGLTALADDSGLEVDALGGAPGVRSARFAKEHDDRANNHKLLAEMAKVPDERRSARFRCALVCAASDGQLLVAEGTCEGVIARAPRGEHGFGYDPLFIVGGSGRTMAELAPEEKNRISHRARALEKMAAALERYRRWSIP